MPLGDSITAGPYYRHALYALRPDTFSVGSVDDVVYVDFPQDRFHEGHGGWRSDEILAQVTTFYTANPAHAVLLLIGANDALGSRDPVSVVGYIMATVAAIHAVNPSAWVFVGTTLNFASWESPRNVYANAYAAGIVAAMNSTAVGRAMAVQMPTLADSDFEADGIHPNATGAPKIAQAFAAALALVFAKPRYRQ